MIIDPCDLGLVNVSKNQKNSILRLVNEFCVCREGLYLEDPLTWDFPP